MSTTPQKDSVAAAIKRNLSLKKIGTNISRLATCYKERGAQAAYREVAYRVALATHGELWHFKARLPLRRELKEQRAFYRDGMPLVSVIVPVYNPPKKFFKQLVDSVLLQSYPHFELILADGGDSEVTAGWIKRYKDHRIKHHPIKNEGISGNTTKAFEFASGELLTLLDHDDALLPHALYSVVAAHLEHNADLLYSDEVVLDSTLKHLRQFHFKPDFSQHYLTGCNYITHLCAFTSQLLDTAGRFEDERYEGAGDYDLILRLSEHANKIYHIKSVLYLWRGHDLSTAAGIDAKPYAIAAGARAVNDHLLRKGIDADVSPIKGRDGAYKVHYRKVNGSVSVVIPNCEHKKDLQRCLQTLYANAGHDNFDVIVVENNSKSKEIFDFYAHAQQHYDNLKVVHYDGEFNFAAVCNFGVQHCYGEHILLLNNDIEITSPDFLREMLSYSIMEIVGAVGAKLIYPNGKIQHAGVIVGINNSAGHSHKSHPGDSGGDMYRLCTPQNYLAVTAAALMTERSLYERMGGLNEQDFAVAFNDVDYCLRLYKSGFINVMTPHAVATHHESLSRGTDTHGESAKRFEGELSRLRTQYADIFAEGDPYYNPHLTYRDESYGWE